MATLSVSARSKEALSFAVAPDKKPQHRTGIGVGLFDVQPLPYQFPLMVTQAIPFFSYTVDKNPGNGSFYNFGGQNITFPANRLRVSCRHNFQSSIAVAHAVKTDKRRRLNRLPPETAATAPAR